MKRTLKKLQKPRRGIQYIVLPETREALSPFVFFDAGIMQRNDEGLHIGMHPHSGIGIITYFEGADLVHDDSGNHDEFIRDGGVQWIRAGGGVWHKEHYAKQSANTQSPWPLTLHQLWMQLPPELEESQVEYQNIQPEDLPIVGPVKVIVGTYQGLQSPLRVPYEMTYLDIRLEAGAQFQLQTPKGQTRGFIFPRSGELELYDESLPLQHLSILEDNEGLLDIRAKSKSQFVLLMAASQNYPILTKGGSIHTNQAALLRSIDRIKAMGHKVRL